MAGPAVANKISDSQMSDLRSSGSLPGVMPTSGEMRGVLAPQGPRPVLTMYQQVSMPPIPSSQPTSQPVSNNASMAGMLDSLKMPSHDMGSLAASLKSPIAPTADNGPQVAPVTQSQSQATPEKSNALENMAASFSPGNLGNMWADVKKGVNPIIQFAKQVLNIVSASLIASFSFLFRQNK